MDYFAGLDVSVKETSVCIVDGAGRIVREVKVASEPQALPKVLTRPTASSGLDWKLDHYHSGCLAHWPKQSCR